MSKSRPPKPPDNLANHPLWRRIMETHGTMFMPIRIDLSDASASKRQAPALRREEPKPSRGQLPALVRDAKTVITFDGGNPRRRPTKRQQIHKVSYAYGILWGIAHSLDCSVGDVLDLYSADARHE